ncbi:multicopper oxidase domain-containing protein [Cellulosimicrobium sp. CUA-896]|uniref:multicopper oxidase domain-containing protein n=1 Tax=Cellulosimicrobium sp. CUA-896 TaxID=1517881 RepID=UPI000AF08AE2|nr:multicopper oxidase domain-containing protein [Cellulosimicrobium sp. CUA-896]
MSESTDLATPKKPLSRRSLLMGAGVVAAAPAAALVLGSGGSVAAAPAAAAVPSATDGSVRRITMYAERIDERTVGYGFEPGTATVPGPVLEMWEGETLEITLVNTTDQRLSIHPHGVNYDVNSDGSPYLGSFNERGRRARTPGRRRRCAATAASGCRAARATGTTTTTRGATTGRRRRRGPVRRARGAPHRRRAAGEAVHGRVQRHAHQQQDGPGHPDVRGERGERVEFICIGHGNTFHTFHLHAHRWANNRTGLLSGRDDVSQVVDNRDLNPGDSFGFQVVAGLGVGPGAWMYHCHVQFHADGGMAGIFLVRNPDGSMPPGAQEAIDRYSGHQHTAATTTQTAPEQGAHAGH